MLASERPPKKGVASRNAFSSGELAAIAEIYSRCRQRQAGRGCPSRGSPARDLSLCADELIGAALERIVSGERLGIGERQILHHDHAGDAARRIDPEVCVVDAAPAQAAGGALAGNLIDGDEE